MLTWRRPASDSHKEVVTGTVSWVGVAAAGYGNVEPMHERTHRRLLGCCKSDQLPSVRG